MAGSLSPGPWIARHATRNELHIGPIVMDATGASVALVVYAGDTEQSRANAQAIAKVHELVHALRELVDRCDGPEGVRGDGSNIDTRGAHAALGDFE